MKIVEKHTELSDKEFEIAFRTGTLPVIQFTHEAHLRLAWIHINNYGLKGAETNIVEQLKNFVDKAGASDKFNLTLTLASIKLVNHFISISKSTSFNSFMNEFPKLKNDFKKLISEYYSLDIFNSEEAKRVYMTPDLKSFD